MGLTYDKSLTFHNHILDISKKAAGKIASLRRITWLTNQKDLETLYKAQIRSSLEFAPLAWGGASPTHLALLDKVQRRAERVIYGEEQSQLQPLQQRRDVAAMGAMFRIHVEQVEHLQELRQPPRPVSRRTREATRTEHALLIRRCQTFHHQRQFVAVYTRQWNDFMATEAGPQARSLQTFKCAFNRWISTPV